MKFFTLCAPYLEHLKAIDPLILPDNLESCDSAASDCGSNNFGTNDLSNNNLGNNQSGNSSSLKSCTAQDKLPPYFGILIEVAGKSYLVPLSAGKSIKAKVIKNPTVFQLITKSGNYVGALKLNNMVPVDSSVVSEVTESQLQQYNLQLQKLINTQRTIILQHLPEIVSQAQKLYKLVAIQENSFYCDISNKFKLLEQALASHSV